MDISIIRDLAEKRDGGIKKLASDIGMSEANLHRCINKNSMQAADLEKVAIALNVDIRLFFEERAIKYDSKKKADINSDLLDLCKQVVTNYQQRDQIMSQLCGMLKSLED